MSSLLRSTKRGLLGIAAAALIAGTSSAHVGLQAPLGGEVVTAGSTFTIQWTVVISHNLQNWDLWYSSTGSAGPFIPIAMDLPAGSGAVGSIHTYDWTIPDVPSDEVFVRVRMDNTGTDYFDIKGPVTIIGSASTTPYGCGLNPPGSLTVLSGAPTLGGTVTFGIDNPLGTQYFGSIPFLAASQSPDPNFPCGTPLAAFGMGPGPGELLIDLFPPNLLSPILVGPPWLVPGAPSPIAVAVPNDTTLLGTSVFFQGLLLDPTALFGVKFGLTEGAETYIGI